MEKKFVQTALLWVICLVCMTVSVSRAETVPSYYGAYGTVKHITGKTVIVSVFADDASSKWDFNSKADSTTYSKMYKRMKIGMKWLESQVRKRTKEDARIIWDWMNSDDLYYVHSFSSRLTDMNASYSVLSDYIRSSIPIEQIMKAHGAQNILFAFFVNAPSSDAYRSYTWCANFQEIQSDWVFYECCVFFPYARGREATPALFAHEVLHTFGAYDLYETHEGSPVTQAYIDYLNRKKIREIMNYCIWDRFDKVTLRFSDLDAYYVGLGSYKNDWKKWNLGQSIYDRWPENR